MHIYVTVIYCCKGGSVLENHFYFALCATKTLSHHLYQKLPTMSFHTNVHLVVEMTIFYKVESKLDVHIKMENLNVAGKVCMKCV